MLQVEVTDEMVRKLREMQLQIDGKCEAFETVRLILEATFNPPAEPEIVVTAEMQQAGLNAYYHQHNPPPNNWTNPHRLEEITRTYRAMRKLEPQSSSNGVGPFLNKVGNVRYDHYRKGDSIGRYHSHRRKDD